MFIKQLSVFVQNKKGRLADITDILAKSDIDIRAISVADTSEFGILRLIVDKPEVAVLALREKGMTVSLTDVIGICIEDKPGEFAKVIKLLADKDIQLEYMYAFISCSAGKAFVILRVDNEDTALNALKENSIKILSEQEIIEI